MKSLYPRKIKSGDGIRILSPARSLSMPWMNDEIKKIANERLKKFGLEISFGKHIYEIDEYSSSSVKSRVSDLHDAFKDKSISIIQTVIGGFNVNEILEKLDYDLIKNNPKIICGYSDITALSNAIYAKTGLVTYSGPHYIDFGEKKEFDYTLEYFYKCFFSNKEFNILPSKSWSSDRWGDDQENRKLFFNDGHFSIIPGQSSGTIIGGNLITYLGLAGSSFSPNFEENTVLFLEEDKREDLYTFKSHLTSITSRDDFNNVVGIIFGRFQPQSNISNEQLSNIIKNNDKLKKIPSICGLDFGHTTPKISFPIGGEVEFISGTNKNEIKIIKH